jgi:hypothetical protein
VECGLPLVTFTNADIIVPPADVQLSEVARILEPMDKVVDEREQIPILPGDCIQSSVVLTKRSFPSFFLMKKTGASRGDLDCQMRLVTNTSSKNASISVCSVRVIG